MSDRPLKVAFCHPALYLGGAERLVLNAARALRSAGHEVAIFSAYQDARATESVGRERPLDLRIHGSFLPGHVRNRLRAPCAILRQTYLASVIRASRERFDLIFADLVSAPMPLLRWAAPRVLFYCHYPDLLLSDHSSKLRRIYRAPLDALERTTVGMADRVLVNSRFTAEAFQRVFPELDSRAPEVLYPGVDVIPLDELGEIEDSGTVSILSINRFDAAKNLDLLIDAFVLLRDRLPAAQANRLRLVLAGAYQPEVEAQRQVFESLAQRVEDCGLSSQVELEPSPSEARRRELLRACRCFAYSPIAEHFGLGPVEAMAAARPVVAVDSGGPRETVVDGVTGLLTEPSPAAFATALARLIDSPEQAQRMGRSGWARAKDHFSMEVFSRRLVEIVETVAV